MDEVVASSLKMAYNKQIMPQDDPYHPTFYYFFLIVFLGIYILFLKLTGYPLSMAASSASVSWINLVNTDPFLASSLYIAARALSALLGVGMVFIVYLITKKIYGRRAGLFSALILTLSAGFVADNHYAKVSALINFLSVLTVYFCVKAVYNSRFKRDFFIASFLAGLSLATKFNGGILVLPLIITYLYDYTANHPYGGSSMLYFIKYIKDLICSRIVTYSIGFYFLAFCVAFPAIFLHTAKYYSGFNFYKQNYFIGNLSFGKRILDLLSGVMGYLYKIIDIYGIFLFLIVFFGFLIALKNKNKGKSLILAVVVPYFFIISNIQVLNYPNAKYIILIIPFLSIFGGLFFDRLMESKKIAKGLKYAILSSVIVFSFFHTLSTEMIFIKDDIRYFATKWIEENVKPGASIEIFSELDWNFSSRLLKKYDVIFFGTNSKNITNTSQFKIWTVPEKIKEYFRGSNINGPKADYIVLSSTDFTNKIFKNIRDEERAGFLNNLLNGKWNYRVVKKISYDGRPIFSHIIDYTPMYILILKKYK